MKRESHLFDKITDTTNLAVAAYKAFRGKAHVSEVKEFRQDFLNNINILRDEITTGEINNYSYHKFVIYEPKKRLISSVPLKQRIFHHAIMNVCHAIFDRQLIYDSYASRPGKGTHRAINRVKNKIKGYKYFAKLDVKTFFDSVDHDVLKHLLRRLFKDYRLLSLFDEIIDSYGNAKGLPIGNLTSQYFANYYLSPLDHFMKEIVRVPVYVRYMDDVILMHDDKDRLKRIVQSYCDYACNNLKLRIKPPIIGRTCHGIPFLGYVIYQHRILMNGKGKRRFRKNLKQLKSLFQKAKIGESEYSSRLNSNLAYTCFADSYKFRESVLG